MKQGATVPLLEPVLTYQVLLPQGCDPHTALGKLRLLEEEDPQLHVVWNEQLREIHVQLMGAGAAGDPQPGAAGALRPGGRPLARAASSTGRPSPPPWRAWATSSPCATMRRSTCCWSRESRAAACVFASACPEDQLDRNWQRLVLTHLEEREHPGVLTGSPITDMKITLVAGRAHVKHTEGGDFRQATYRAVRQGLMQAESILLEPWYDFRLELPAACVGRALSDLQRMDGETDPPESQGEETVLTGSAPVAGLRDYSR